MPPEYSPSDYALLGRSGLSNADIAGLTGQSLRLNWPMAGAALLSVIPSIYQSYEQGKELKRLKKEGPQDVTPEAFKTYQSQVAREALSSRLPGEGIARDEITRQQAMTQANIQRMSQNPAQALRAAMALNQQGVAARNQLTMAGARDQARRRAIANEAMMKRAMFQEQGRKEYAATIGALEAAKMQNINKAVQGGLSGLLNSFVLGGARQAAPLPPPPPGATGGFTTTETGNAIYQQPSYIGMVGNTFGGKDIPYEDTVLFR
jgi:hypothetical protein